MNHNHLFFKFMHDIIDSGVWSQLSSTARTLYPVLCRFSNESFKPVWPGTDELLRLTGFKTKKSLQLAKKELVDAGLIDIIAGNGRTSSRYYFKFQHKNSKIDIDLYRDTIISLRGIKEYHATVDNNIPQGSEKVTPNNINININTINNEKQESSNKNIENLLKNFMESTSNTSSHSYKEQIIKNMLTKYGELETGEAIKIAMQKDRNGDIHYLEGILKNRSNKTKYNHPNEINKNLNNVEFQILKDLNKKFNNINYILEYHYFYNNIYYFKTNDEKSIMDIEKYAKEIGYNIKLLFSKQSNIENKPTIRFISNL